MLLTRQQRSPRANEGQRARIFAAQKTYAWMMSCTDACMHNCHRACIHLYAWLLLLLLLLLVFLLTSSRIPAVSMIHCMATSTCSASDACCCLNGPERYERMETRRGEGDDMVTAAHDMQVSTRACTGGCDNTQADMT